jgi:hypothetical protein
MKFATIIVTRSKSCHVKTLHGVLRLNMKCLQNNHDNEIVYVNDDPYEKAELIQAYMKKYERIIFIDFGIGIDEASLEQCFSKHEGVGCLVFPGVKEGIDWKLFREKVKSGSSEPVSQMGLHFDTDVGKKISENIYQVTSTDAKAWMMNTKNVIKSIKDKKTGNWKISPKMFEKFREQNVRMYAYTAAKLTMTYTHECVSNILNAAGVKVN